MTLVLLYWSIFFLLVGLFSRRGKPYRDWAARNGHVLLQIAACFFMVLTGISFIRNHEKMLQSNVDKFKKRY